MRNDPAGRFGTEIKTSPLKWNDKRGPLGPSNAYIPVDKGKLHSMLNHPGRLLVDLWERGSLDERKKKFDEPEENKTWRKISRVIWRHALLMAGNSLCR